MMKKNKIKLIFSSIIILLPAVFGLLAWNKLPPEFSSHWGEGVKINGFSSPASFVLILPLILLAINWIMIFISLRDPRFKNQSQKAFNVVIWIIPFVSVFSNGIVYLSLFYYPFNMISLISVFMGVGLILMGNYMPKFKQNYMLGIRTKTTLTSEANWNATHRLAGKMWVVGGIVTLFLAFLPPMPMFIAFFVIMMIVSIVPIIYSYRFYKKNGAEKDEVEYDEDRKKVAKRIILPIIISLLVIPVILFTGKVTVEFGETEFKTDSSYWSALTVEYDSVVDVELRENFDRGSRINGIGSVKLCSGLFENDEFGRYMLYSYTANDTVIVVTTTNAVLVFNMEDSEKTSEIYEQLKEICK